MSGYIGNIPVPQATQTRDVFTATSGQTSFATSGYTPGYLDVWLNGVKLVNGTDFTATNGSDVVLASGAATSDIVEVLSYSTYEVNAQTYTGGLTVNNTGDVLNVDRKGSDGILTTYKKDGNTVGYTTVEGGGAVIRNYWDIRSAASVGSGLGGNDGYLQPFSKTGASDNVIDLGNSTSRFKNLYLSGGVYLGGTGGENLLNDYEEGTWDCTPSTSSSSLVPLSGWSISQQQGHYTKIGQLVVCQYYFEWSNTNSSSSAVHMILPFAVKGNNCWNGNGTEVSSVAFPSGVTYVTVRPEQNNVYASFKGCGTSHSRSDMRFNNFGTYGSGYALGSFSYFTDA